MKVVLPFVAACCLASSIHANPITITVPESNTAKLGEADYRLERSIQPINYKIDFTLAADFVTTKKFQVDNCEILFMLNQNIQKDTNIIRIHYGLDFKENSVKLFDSIGNEIEILTFTGPNLDTEIAVITLKENLNVRKMYKLQFTGLLGTLRNNMSGFYLSKYKVGTTDKYIATTQFQATDARAAFPCFDEPSFKATFEISITRPKEYETVLANTKEIDDVVTGELSKITFAKTPKMSTYLVAFIVSTFAKIDDPNYAVFFPEGMTIPARYAFKKTPEIIKDLGEKLQITYPELGNPQLSQAAIPDFSAGAMENWGLATYRETALLWDPSESTVRNKQRVCSVIAHEISHMWFGDYVTMDWWSEAWLNEGFARYFEYHTTANVEPDFDMKNQFVVEQQQVIFNADAVSTSLPLSSATTDIYTPNQVNSKFGSITYNKGGSVLRMFERAMGETKFLEALSEYLTENKESNTLSSQLISKLQKFDLKIGVMENWIKLSGYPVVTVKREGENILLSQQRFLVDGMTSTNKWAIPITYATKTHNENYLTTTPDLWMEQSATTPTTMAGVFKDTEMIILNVQGSGYYRVNYEKDLLVKITTQLRTASKGDIPSLDRAILIDDVMSMARVGLQTYDLALDLTKYLAAEVEYYPWVSAFNSFAFLNKRIGLDNGEVSTWFKDYVTRMSDKLYKSVSFDNLPTDHIEILKTVLSLQSACEQGVSTCVSKSKALFAEYAKPETTVNPINPNLRSVVYCNGIRYGGEAEWTFLFNKFLSSSLASEKVTIIAALGCSKVTKTLEAFLEKSVAESEDEIRKQDAYSVFTAVVNGNPENLNTAFNFLVKNFKLIISKYASTNALSNIFNLLSDRFTTKAQVDEFKSFLTTNAAELGEATSVGNSAVATAEANLAWTNKFLGTIRYWLNQERDSGNGAIPTTATSLLVIVTAFFVTFYN